jgi:hypothetical protein
VKYDNVWNNALSSNHFPFILRDQPLMVRPMVKVFIWAYSSVMNQAAEMCDVRSQEINSN